VGRPVIRKALGQTFTNAIQLVDFSNQQQSTIAGEVTAIEVGQNLALAEATKVVAR
jgi:hypothetical protein